VVACIEVLEHCASPTVLLRAAAKALRPGGLFYYTTSMFDGYYETLRSGDTDHPSWQGWDEYITPEGHVSFFSTPVMRQYFAKAGFSRVFSAQERFCPDYQYRTNRWLYRTLRGLKLIRGGDLPKASRQERHLYNGASWMIYHVRRLLRRQTVYGRMWNPYLLARK